MIAFVYGDTGGHISSPYTGCKRMSELIPDSICVSDKNADYNKLRELGYTIFCYGHKPSLYTHRKINKNCLYDVVNTRAEWLYRTIGIKCQSGFSYIKRMAGKYDCYFPTITTYKRKKEPETICIGYYSRGIRPDTEYEFKKYISTIPLEIPVVIMGEKIDICRNYIYTTDEDIFFSLCTHYFYMKSSIHDDPWPHTLLQACQCGCSILMPYKTRTWKDGIDDILDVCDVLPINIYKELHSWDIIRKCTFSPKGEDFLKLYNMIIEKKWHWIPEHKNFSDLYEYILKL